MDFQSIRGMYIAVLVKGRKLVFEWRSRRDYNWHSEER